MLNQSRMLEGAVTPDEIRAEAERLHRELVNIIGPRVCSLCDKPASCFGMCEGEHGFFCDECCSHEPPDLPCISLDADSADAGSDA